MSMVVRPVRPKAVSWKSEGRVVIHHCNISVGSVLALRDFLLWREELSYLEAQDSAADGLEKSNAVS